MSERDNILGRIQEALKIKAPRPDPPSEIQPPVSGARRWLPPVGEHFKDWVEAFSRNCRESRERSFTSKATWKSGVPNSPTWSAAYHG